MARCRPAHATRRVFPGPCSVSPVRRAEGEPPVGHAAARAAVVFWPHGPLPYIPFHLSHVDGRPLADEWTVTTVASSAQLLPGSTGHRRRRRLLVVGAPSADVRFQLPDQPQIVDHARELARRVPRARLLVGDDATPRTVLAATRKTDYLHIAAHGSQDVEAPWCQCLYLSPDPGENDGRLFAHQILALDLRGVDLVTLSACESAMGRYDLNDNPRGLPAAFLLAGARTVVGVLWPVTAPVATLFFDDLYTRLAAGDTKRDAFRHAQLATRVVHPAYRDRGAFTLIGDWR
ncbi:CHAT domain-containing protein [Streptomyces triticirhizae]|uniref:CHAT domain-containing protein n=1 Tax=Streptomyces triticirhizae TaxID=2483353 RepID=UPI0022776801|nr:CHAT domain-containing protein [Streptomyces triticirhizae]